MIARQAVLLLPEEKTSRKSALRGQVVPTAEMDHPLKERLFELFSRYYLHVDRSQFDRDQAEKDWVLVLSDARDEVQGFTTLKRFEIEILDRRLQVVFSGNTIIDRAFWGTQELVATWCRFMAQLLKDHPHLPLYWLLVSSGYRTYLYLPLFFYHFYPCYDNPTPEFERHLIDTLGRMKYPDEYGEGVVHVSRPRECLLPEIAVPDAAKRDNPHIRFFLERNPGAFRGDDLVCVTEFSLENTRRLAHTSARQVLLD
jgi:hypothetical protein